jgi:3-hydroxybutyryl-CoA dehydratase
MASNSYLHSFSFSQDQVRQYALLTGDNNPIHLDEYYAKNSIFKETIVHGMLTMGIISMVIGTKYPGMGTIYLNQEIKFRKPVYVNVEYKCEVELLEVFNEKHRALLATRILRDGELVMDGTALVINRETF